MSRAFFVPSDTYHVFYLNRKSVAFFLRSYLLIFSLLFSLLSYSETRIQILVYQEHLEAIETLHTADKACHEQDLDRQPNIHLMETVLICKALFLGGGYENIEFIPTPTQLRAVRYLEHGTYPIFGNSIWSYLTNQNIFMSDAVVKKHAYKKGIYTSPNNIKVLSSQNAEDLKKFKAVVGGAWHVDRQVLDCHGFQQNFVPNYEQMVRMVFTERNDFILNTFGSGEDMLIEEFGMELVPVKNIKFSLPDSLHFFVSRKHADGPVLFEALTAGLEKMTREGHIYEGYKSIGFYSDSTEDWVEFRCK